MNLFKHGDVVVLKSGGPPMTVNKVPGEEAYPGSRELTIYECNWFRGASSESGGFAEHLLKGYEAPKK
jgi:uncharacterized protein YodC (DUF2158 family)